MNKGEREMYLARGTREVRGYGMRRGPSPLKGGGDQEDMKLYDFLSIFHPEMSHEQKRDMVLDAYPDSHISRR